MREKFIDITGYEELYQISNLGRVKSLRRNIFLIPQKCGKPNNQYYRVMLFKDGGKESLAVHRLLGLMFIPKIKGKEIINHKNGNSLDNTLSNLEWVNRVENSVHSFIGKNTTSKYTGVCSAKDRGWQSKIKVNGKQIHLGFYKTELEAHQARIKFETDNLIENKYI